MNQVKKSVRIWINIVLIGLMPMPSLAMGEKIKQEARESVVVSMPLIAEWVRAIAGDEVEIKVLVNETQALRSKDGVQDSLSKFKDLNLFFALGYFPFEKEVVKQLSDSKAFQITLVAPRPSFSKIPASQNPYTWLDPKWTFYYLNTIRNALKMSFPDKKEIFQKTTMPIYQN